jgi:hypothetical protein
LSKRANKEEVKNDKFYNAGYKGLYNGETPDSIGKGKKAYKYQNIRNYKLFVEL